MKLKPAPGRIVIDPATGAALPAEGREVEASQYWLRRLRDADVVEVADSTTDQTKEP